jgi:hypothetical protein
MAAAILLPTLLSAAIPLVTPLVQSLVIHAEHLFGAKTGQQKFQSVLAAVTPVVDALSTAGKIPGTLDGVAISSIIESVVQDLKAKNILNPSVVIPQIAGSTGSGNAFPMGSVKVSGTLTLG